MSEVILPGLERIRTEKENIQARYAAEISAYFDAAVKFAVFLTHSLFFANAGGLLVFPAYIAAVKEQGAGVDTVATTLSTSMFVAGLVFAVLSGYIGYLNFHNHANFKNTLRQKELLEVDETYDSDRSQVLNKQREMYRRNLSDILGSQQKFMNRTFWIGQAFGGLALACFVLGCIMARRVMLG